MCFSGPSTTTLCLNLCSGMSLVFSGTGFNDEADEMLGKFKWGHAFRELNEELLEIYSGCSDSASVVAAQTAFLEKADQENQARRHRKLHPEEAGKGSDDFQRHKR